ncbi:MAG: T9SS type A sorting domain-containing protein, partial [Bacteroidota bacterium]
LVDVDITSYAISGGLAGSAYLSQVSACSVTGNILTGSIHAGGLIGMVSESEIHGCYSNVTVSCLINDAGGLLGWQNGGVTENCYATGMISGNNYSGGLIGNISSQAIIKNSYAKGVVGGNYIKSGLVGFGDGTQLVENSYWDIETSGTETSAGGVGMNTQEMLMQESFENWDFEFTWKIEEYKTYPYLAWQQSPGEHNVSTGWYLLSGRVYPHGAGTVTGAGIYTAGQHVMVSASAFDGFVFEKWVDFEGSYITDQSEFYFIMPDQHVLFSAIFSIVSATDQWAGTNPFIFPNPFSDIITIENVTAVKQVVMTNIYGQVVLQKYLNGSESDSFQTRDLPSGVYMVFLLNENNTPKAVKMIKW